MTRVRMGRIDGGFEPLHPYSDAMVWESDGDTWNEHVRWTLTFNDKKIRQFPEEVLSNLLSALKHPDVFMVTVEA